MALLPLWRPRRRRNEQYWKFHEPTTLHLAYFRSLFLLLFLFALLIPFIFLLFAGLVYGLVWFLTSFMFFLLLFSFSCASHSFRNHLISVSFLLSLEEEKRKETRFCRRRRLCSYRTPKVPNKESISRNKKAFGRQIHNEEIVNQLVFNKYYFESR